MKTTYFFTALTHLTPEQMPMFTHGWMNLMAHPVTLGSVSSHSWVYASLLQKLFCWLRPTLAQEGSSNPCTPHQQLIFIVCSLLNNAPDFLSNYCNDFLEQVPMRCSHLKNMLCSAAPRNSALASVQDAKFEDMSRLNLKVPKNLSVMQPPFATFPSIEQALSFALHSPNAEGESLHLMSLLQSLPATYDSTHKNDQYKVFFRLVEYIGREAVGQLQDKAITIKTVEQGNCYQLLRSLLVRLDYARKTLLLDCLLDQLRYPNASTQYFGCVIVQLFSEICPSERDIRDLTMTLLSTRLLTPGAHPWGIQVVFPQLIATPEFWSAEFLTRNPDLKSNVLRVISKLMPAAEEHLQPA